MEKVEWKVEGMDCTNCALTITKYLQKTGQKEVKVNFIGGEVSFDHSGDQTTDELKKGISDLGYQVMNDKLQSTNPKPKTLFTNHLQRFLFCLPFTLVLMLHMLPWHIHFLMNPWTQLAICLPVFIIGMGYFGISAYRSLRRGVPNMNVLITVGSLAAFIYSLIGAIGGMGMNYLFFETTATIITLVFLGEWVEHKAVQSTQKALNQLARQQKVMANMIAFDDEHKEQIFPVENDQLRVGDLVLIRSGEQVPTDCKILWGEAHVSEALMTGESRPLKKVKKDPLIGGSLLTDGTVKAQVTAVGKDTVLSNILNLVKQAQGEKPPVQQLADRISAIFVPVVLGLALIAFLLNYFVFDQGATHALMRSIAVLVISCPCAMGLATPAAIAVGLGRAAKNGILFRNAKSLESFRNIRTVVFDKTGTLTKGTPVITAFKSFELSEERFRQVVYSLEKYSNHPIAKTILQEWKTNTVLPWKKIEEIKGLCIKAEDKDGNIYQLGSYKIADSATSDRSHSAYLLLNDKLIGWIDLDDEVREEAKAVISYLQSNQIDTILLSGDSLERCNKVAGILGINKVYAERSPADKLEIIESINRESPVAMVGDGINDAPALAKATIGISMSDASQLAMQTAQVVLMNKGIGHLPLALGLGKHSYITIKENLFWAFIYNIVAIPVAAIGLLNPGIAALAMGFSDVVLAINSIRLNYKKVI
ncbi:MAG: cadmium-translocating P-type ATPase [Chitinophagaceae bacterium]|nr:cadmium-translocating P-type ATPase [Chitinophagaceae bacterium]